VFALLFEDGPGGELAAPPADPRGPRYTITWTFPNGAGGENKVRQSVWPYAPGGPLTHMAPGQPVLDTTTTGGWYRADDDLRQSLITLGLPRRQPLASPATTPAAAGAVDNGAQPASRSATLPHRGAEPGTGSPWAAPAVGLLLVAAAGTVVVLRRRSRPGTAAR